MVFIPFFTAVLVAPRVSLVVGVALAAVLFAFLLRYPVELLILPQSYIRAGRPPKTLLVRSAWVYSVLLVGAGLALVWVWKLYALLLLAGLAGGLFLFRIRQGLRGAERGLSSELLGTAGLTLSALVAWVAATGRLDSAGWLIWLLNCGFFTGGVLYVKSRLRARVARHQPGEHPSTGIAIAFHVLLLLLVLGLVAATSASILLAVPFLLAAARAVWGLRDVRRAFALSRLGWSEVALSLIFAGFIAWSFPV